MNGSIQAERYIISAENLTYKTVVTDIANNFGIKPPATLATPWMMGLAWRTASVIAAITRKDPFLDKISAQAASMTRNYDNTKIKKAIGIEFKPISYSIREICANLQIKSPL